MGEYPTSFGRLSMVDIRSESLVNTLRLSRLVPVLCGAALFSLVRGAPAQGPLGVIGGEALDVTAEKLDVDVDKGTATLNGKVRAKLGELQVECPKVEIRYDNAPNVRFARGTGGVRAVFRDIVAKARTVEVDVSKRQLVLSGGVELARGRGWVHADRALIDLTTRKVSLEEVTGSIPVEPPAR
jgi:lipopolysaccharide export system protein LptA